MAGAVGRRKAEGVALRSTTGGGGGKLPSEGGGAKSSTRTGTEAASPLERSGTPAITAKKPVSDDVDALARASAVDRVVAASSPVPEAAAKRAVDATKASFTPRDDSDEI